MMRREPVLISTVTAMPGERLGKRIFDRDVCLVK